MFCGGVALVHVLVNATQCYILVHLAWTLLYIAGRVNAVPFSVQHTAGHSVLIQYLLLFDFTWLDYTLELQSMRSKPRNKRLATNVSTSFSAHKTHRRPVEPRFFPIRPSVYVERAFRPLLSKLSIHQLPSNLTVCWKKGRCSLPRYTNGVVFNN
jgi:hypothetical protein